MSNIIISCLGNVLYLIIQRWGKAYRDNSFHECININNGTEALNKALKYTYLPRGQRSINLSKIVTLLVETFLPTLRQKYLFANFEQSSVNRRYKDEIPKYLHNKPKTVILHCLDRKASSARFCSDDITDIDATKGIFQVNSTDAHQYTINFIISSCSCPDWTQHQYPCKHFFLQSFVYVPSGTGMHYLSHTLPAHSSVLIQTLLIPTSQMTPASRFVNLLRMKTWVWEINKCKHRKMTVQTWTSTQENFQWEKSVLYN